ncbi:MAG TPA: hypothetical protein VMI10_06605 [Terriglobales bacterium]|nr:hypothetical protein [Terriglobales bacterium]
MDGSIIPCASHSVLKVVAKVRNVGLSRVSIQKKGTALHLHSALTPSASPPTPCQTIWNEEPAVFEVFKDDTDIEPSEPIEDHVLVELPMVEAPAYKLALTVCSKKGLLKKARFWTATSILEVQDDLGTGGFYGKGTGLNVSGPEEDSGDRKTESSTEA